MAYLSAQKGTSYLVWWPAMEEQILYTAVFPEGRLDQFLSRVSGQSRMFVKTQIEAGHIFLNGKTVDKGAMKIRPGDKVTGHFEEEVRLDLKPMEGPLAILYEDEHLIVLDKQQGLVVHPAAGHRGETLVHFLLHHLQSSKDFVETSPVRPGIVHRLDVGTSGVLVIAKTRASLESISAQFKERTVQKEYEALAWGRLAPNGIFKSSIGRHPGDRKKMSSKAPLSRAAETRFKVIRQYPHFAHIQLLPKTGRTHQLRVHLSENRNPIVGDGMYGGQTTHARLHMFAPEIKKALAPLIHPCLHARALAFDHPATGVRLEFEAPRPKEWDQVLPLLEKYDR
jgi:23S rRNA pseudouridine1911/1915/1917 synthase